MTVTLPETLQYGKVVGRFVLAVADVPEDPDALPNAVPAVGTINFTSTNPITKEAGATPPTTVIRTVISAAVDANGEVYNPKDPEGPRGIWLVAGVYKVGYSLSGAAITGHDIHVLPEHDDLTPLDLLSALPPGGPILTASQYAELTARMDILEVGGGGGGVTSHAELDDRDAANQHPMSAITGLGSALTNLSDAIPTDYVSSSRTVAGKALSSDVTIGAADLTATGTKDGTTVLHGDNTWKVPAGGGGGGLTVPSLFVPHISGTWMALVPPNNGTSILNTSYCVWPVWLPEALTFNRLRILVSTAVAESSIELAMWNNAAARVLLETFDSSTVGVKECVGTYAFGAGVAYLGIRATSGVPRVNQGATRWPFPMDYGSLDNTTNHPGVSTGWRLNGFPDTLTTSALDTYGRTFAPNYLPPAIEGVLA